MKKKLLNICFPIITILIVFILWTIYSVSVDNSLICPTPKETFKELFTYIKTKAFYTDLLHTILRALKAFLISFVLAFLMAILSKLSYICRKLFLPFLGIIRGIPTMAILLILAFSLDVGDRPVIVSMIVLLPLLYSTILGSLDNVDDKIIEMAEIYKVEKKDIVFKIYLREIAKPLIEGLASAASFNLKLIISAEAIAYPVGCIGTRMKYEQINLEMAKVFALTIVAVLLGVIIEAIIRGIGRLIVRWDNDRD